MEPLLNLILLLITAFVLWGGVILAIRLIAILFKVLVFIWCLIFYWSR